MKIVFVLATAATVVLGTCMTELEGCTNEADGAITNATSPTKPYGEFGGCTDTITRFDRGDKTCYECDGTTTNNCDGPFETAPGSGGAALTVGVATVVAIASQLL